MSVPTPGLTYQTSATPNTPVDALAASLTGGYVINPVDAIDDLYVDPTGPASTTANGTTSRLPPGAAFFAIPNSTVPVSVASKVPSHVFIAVQWV